VNYDIINIGDIIIDPLHVESEQPYGIVIKLNKTRTKAIILWLRVSESSWYPDECLGMTAVLGARRLKLARVISP
jgi:hypothetical protein